MADRRRRLLTGALDDLGERDHLPPGRRDEDPAYPPDATDTRPRRLRWRWWLEQGAAVVVGVLAAVAGLQLTAGRMPHPLLQGVVAGGGVGLAYNAAGRGWSDDTRARATQLYGLLRRIDADDASSHSDTS